MARHGGNKVEFYLFLSKAAQDAFPVNRTEFYDICRDAADAPPLAPTPRRSSATVATLRRLDDYIRRDEQSLSRQRLILADCDGPARAIAQATVAEYEQALDALYRRRARLLARA